MREACLGPYCTLPVCPLAIAIRDNVKTFRQITGYLPFSTFGQIFFGICLGYLPVLSPNTQVLYPDGRPIYLKVFTLKLLPNLRNHAKFATIRIKMDALECPDVKNYN